MGRRGVRRWLFLVGFLMAAGAWGEKKALLVGVGDYIYMRDAADTRSELPPGDLRGPRNDVVAMRELLVKKYGFPEGNVRVLLDQEATEANVRRALEAFVGEARKDDWLLFFYSGHGSRILESNWQREEERDEEDGWDETIVCADDERHTKGIKGYRHIVDDELKVLLGRAQQRGAKVMMIADACHSGTLSRDLLPPHVRLRYLPPAEEEVKGEGRFIVMPTREMVREAGVKDGGLEGVTLLAACRDEEKAADAEFPGIGWHGALTYALLEVLGSGPADLTFRHLARRVREIVSVRFQQTPQLDGVGQDWLVFGGMPAGAPTVVQVSVTVAPGSPPPPVAPPTGEVLYIAVQGFKGEEQEVQKALEASPYLRVAGQMAWADRVLMGVRQGEVLSARLALLDSTVEAEARGRTAEEVVQRLRPMLLKGYLIKQVAQMGSARPELGPEVEVVRARSARVLRVRPVAYEPLGTTVCVGDVVQFRVRVQQPCYVTLLNIGSDGSIQVLFPNRYHPWKERVQPGQWYTVPSPAMKFEIYADRPVGREMVVALATVEPLEVERLRLRALPGALGEAGLKALEDEEAGARVFRLRPVGGGLLPPQGYAVAYTLVEVIE